MSLKIGQQFGNIDSIKILMSHPVVKKKLGFNPTFLAPAIALLTRIYGFPPPPLKTYKRRLNSENFVVKKIIGKHISSFLEFGSGFGNIALTISSITNSKGICVDMDQEDISTLNKLAQILNLHCKGLIGDVLKMDFPEESFDVIYSLEVLEHIEDIKLLLELSFKWLRPGGRFIFQTPFHYKIMPDETEHQFGHVRNGFNEYEFEIINNGLFSFDYNRVEFRSNYCKFCGEEFQKDHPLKLIGIGTKIKN